MKTKIVGYALSTLIVLLPCIASAQVNVGGYGSTFGIGTADLESAVITVVQWVLGFLALIAVIMIIYGGFILLTVGGGNAERAASSKKIIIAAVIGLVVVLLAWAIVTFVVGTTSNVAGG
ncbi:MAG: hypothetical protein PHY34_01860 [Patescibacteria group bacterium]|nr:hypothetical protein [Patescibacteria group bacterium]MDD5715320.1 hypothetical protein [Patescibacteria group bacterium]